MKKKLRKDKKKPERFSLQNKLVVYYFALLVAIAVIVYVTFSSFYKDLTKNQMTANTSSICKKLCEQVDNSILDMEQLVVSVQDNSIVNRTLFSLINDDPAGKDTQVAADTIRDALRSINGSIPKAYAINVFYLKKNLLAGITASYDEREAEYDSRKWQRLKYEFMSFDGEDMVFFPPYQNWWCSSDNEITISLCKKVMITKTDSIVVEIKKEYATFDSICSLKENVYNQTVFILDNNYEPVYPYAPDSGVSEIIDRYLIHMNAGLISKSTDPVFSETESDFFVGCYSADSGLHIIIQTPKEVFFEPHTRMNSVMVIAVLAICALTFAVLIMLSKNLSFPIRQLCDIIQKVDYDRVPSITQFYGYKEAQILSDAFMDMNKRLHLSVEAYGQMCAKEAEARFDALQSQINPHFIYNTLTNIIALSDEVGSEDISSMCWLLSQLLRYSSSRTNLYSTIGQEIEHTENYLKLMKYRMKNKLEYEIKMDEELSNLSIPKLVLQPLVENSIKHGVPFKNKVCRISIICIHIDSGWGITIRDNGKGFEFNTLERLTAMISSMRMGQTPDPASHSLGVENVCHRLLLYYDNNIEFAVYNEDGAVIEIYVPYEGREGSENV